MTNFHEVRFPDNIAYGATGGPEFATTVVASFAGGHQIGSMFLALDQAVFRRLIPLADLDAQKTYKAVGRGGVLAEAPRRTITPDLAPGHRSP